MSKVQKVYLTRGDNTYDDEGFKCDKCCAVQIDGSIYWLSQSFSKPSELAGQLQLLGVGIGENFDKGSRYPAWGNIGEDGWATLDHRMIKLTKHHDDIFSDKSSYMKKSVRNPAGSLWWTASALKEFQDNRNPTLEALNKLLEKAGFHGGITKGAYGMNVLTRLDSHHHFIQADSFTGLLRLASETWGKVFSTAKLEKAQALAEELEADWE